MRRCVRFARQGLGYLRGNFQPVTGNPAREPLKERRRSRLRLNRRRCTVPRKFSNPLTLKTGRDQEPSFILKRTTEMSFANTFASLRGNLGMASAVVLALSSPPVLAQTATPQGQPAPQGQAQNAGPSIVNVKAEPSQPDWTKVCGKDPNAGAEVCYTTR